MDSNTSANHSNKLGSSEGTASLTIWKTSKRRTKGHHEDPQESIRLYAAKWEHQSSLLLDHMDEERQMYLFLQSLAERDFRLALFTWIDTATPTKFEQLIQKAIQMEEKANFLRDPLATPRTNDMGTEPMDLDHMQRNTSRIGMEIDSLTVTPTPSTHTVTATPATRATQAQVTNVVLMIKTANLSVIIARVNIVQ